MRAGARELVRRRLTEAVGDPFELVRWSRRDVALTGADGKRAFSAAGVEAPVGWSDLAVAIVARRYFLAGDGEDSIRGLVRRIAGTLSDWAGRDQFLDDEARQAFADELAGLVLTQRATFATPVWLNLGTEERPLTAACFVLGVEDSMPSLLDWNTKEGLIFQQGAGSGANLSAVRSSSEPVSRGGQASGPVSFMRGTDAWAATIRAGGRARRAAKMVVLDADHPDVLEFIRSKAAQEHHARAMIGAGYQPSEVERQLDFQQSNHAVRIPDELMDAAERDGDWDLRAVTTGEVVETIAARALLRECAEACWGCGDPGLQFEETIASWHTCPRSGPISASNPCGEFLHVDDSACNLATLNLAAFLEQDGRFDVDGFIHAIDVMLLAQDLLVDGSGYPSPAIEGNARRFRQLGLGFTNLGTLLLELGLPYDSREARSWAAGLAALLTGAAYRRSAELAAELGAFGEFEANREPMLSVVERHRESLAEIRGLPVLEPVLAAAEAAWSEAAARGAEHGYRNAQVTLVPPGGTVSLMMDCETTGIEPYFSLATRKRFDEGGEAVLESRALSSSLLRLGYETAAISQISDYARRHGHLDGNPDLRPDHRDIFRTAVEPHPISARGQLAMVAAVQPLVSGGISKTVNLPSDVGVDEVEAVFRAAWRLGLKAVAVYRQGSKVMQPMSPPGDEGVREAPPDA